MLTEILKAALIMGGIGLVLGALLVMASRLFEVKTDPRVTAVREALPGAGCGACGYVGCDAFAAAVVAGEAGAAGCPVGGEEAAKRIAEILGVAAPKTRRMNAVVRCCGYDDKTQKKYDYKGNFDCEAAMRLYGGEKSCLYSCIGFGTCVSKCSFGAISIINGVAAVDKERCTACGICVAACPKNLIELMPYDMKYYVGCSSRDKGGVTRVICENGCIGCKICEKTCRYDAIHVVDSHAAIDYDKCTECGECVAKCPRKIIRINGFEVASLDTTSGKVVIKETFPGEVEIEIDRAPLAMGKTAPEHTEKEIDKLIEKAGQSVEGDKN